MTALTVGGVIVAALTLATALAIPTGKALHRAGHRQYGHHPDDYCPPWCVREQAAALAARDRQVPR